MLNMQNVKDIEIPEGDVRTIHDKDDRLIWGRLAYDTKYAGDTVQDGTPTPDTPVAIQVVTGEQTVTIGDDVDSEAFPINLGSIELCKIGTYQDYIYKSGDDWYVHKDIDTQVVDTSNITVRTTYSNLDYAVYSKSATSIFYDNYNEMEYPLLCTHATHFVPGNFNTTDDIGGVFMSGQKTNWWIGFAKNTSLDTMKSDLSGCKLYSPLATPTDTKITDATLLSQLDAVHEWLTRYGYSSTVTGNLPIIINQTNL